MCLVCKWLKAGVVDFICGKTRRGACQFQRKTRCDHMRTRLQDIKATLHRAFTTAFPKMETREVAAGGGVKVIDGVGH